MTNLKEHKKDTSGNLVVNEKIRADKVQLITHDGANRGVVSRAQALEIARESGLDLVLIAEHGKEGFPVAKIMNLGKALYEKKKKLSEARKHQKTIQVKEIKMRPKIGDHDFKTKINQATQFLLDGKRVKITISFKGRENVQKDVRGNEFFQKIEATYINNGMDTVISEQETRLGQLWSRVYYLKTK
jgi:translation initiation factor IF-3